MASAEQDLIRKYLAPLVTNAGADGLRDDAAVLDTPGPLVASKDMLIGDVHFREQDAPADIGWKSVAVNVSDIVAKGAAPKFMFLGLGLPNRHDLTAWLPGFCDGLSQALDHYGISLMGGDLVSPPNDLCISVTLLGEPYRVPIPRRGAAEPGDVIFIAGPIGEAGLGLRLLQAANDRPELPQAAETAAIDAYLRPSPKPAWAPLIARFATASMDVSDGLWHDLASLLTASGLAAEVDLKQVPAGGVPNALIAPRQNHLEHFNAGDDYCPLFTVAPHDVDVLLAEAASDSVELVQIGRLTDRAPTGQIRTTTGHLIDAARGYSHF